MSHDNPGSGGLEDLSGYYGSQIPLLVVLFGPSSRSHTYAGTAPPTQQIDVCRFAASLVMLPPIVMY